MRVTASPGQPSPPAVASRQVLVAIGPGPEARPPERQALIVEKAPMLSNCQDLWMKIF